MVTMAIYVYYLGFGMRKKISEGIAVSYEKSENGDNFWIIVYVRLGMAQILWIDRITYFLRDNKFI